MSYFVKESILASFQLAFDIVEGYGAFDDLVVVGVLPFGRQTKEVVGENATSGGDADVVIVRNVCDFGCST